jgi:hypothetical protein
MTPGEAALRNASVGVLAAVAAFMFCTSVCAGSRLRTRISPTQRGRWYLAVAPLSARRFRMRGNSTRSWPGSRGVSPANPVMRSLM